MRSRLFWHGASNTKHAGFFGPKRTLASSSYFAKISMDTWDLDIGRVLTASLAYWQLAAGRSVLLQMCAKLSSSRGASILANLIACMNASKDSLLAHISSSLHDVDAAVGMHGGMK